MNKNKQQLHVRSEKRREVRKERRDVRRELRAQAVRRC